MGLRLRYAITRRFAPYVGVSWTMAAGETAAYMRAEGEKPTRQAVVIGIKSWF